MSRSRVFGLVALVVLVAGVAATIAQPGRPAVGSGIADGPPATGIGAGTQSPDASVTSAGPVSTSSPSDAISTRAPAPAASEPAPSQAAPSQPASGATDGIRPGVVNRTSMDLTATYDATVRVDFGTRLFRVWETIGVANTSGGAIDRLELNTIVARLGGMSIARAAVAGVAVQPTVTDQTIRLPLGGILDPGASTTVTLAYRATLRSATNGSSWLFTRTNGILEAHRWLPWISRPTPFDRPNHGDPFVTGVSSRVRVRIVSDRPMNWATSGEPVAGGDALTRLFEGRDVRDFALVGAPDFRRTTATVGAVVINVWSRPGFPATSVLTAARTALSREAKMLGAYPYPTYEVAQTAGGYGMESPGLTWIPTGAGSLPYLVAHETAHQWFYGIVGSDQARQPYADEAATDFVARYALGLRRASRCPTARLDLAIYRYSAACYYEAIYIQGGNLLDDTRRAMGATAFWAGIHDYLATYRFKLGSTKALLDTLDAHTPLNLVTRFKPRFPSLY